MKTVSKLSIFLIAAAFTFSCKGNKSESQEAQEVLTAADEVTVFTANTETSKVYWEGFKPLESHDGYVLLAKGEIALDQNNQVASGSFVMDMTTITVTDLEGDGKERLEAHLRGTAEGREDHFFDVNQFPTATFEVTGMEDAEGKTWMRGNLTIKETSRNIKFPVNISLEDDKLVLQSETFEIDRTEFGINYNSRSIFPNVGDRVIYDNMNLTVYLEANIN